ncbi:MAG: hypothetical protein IT564_11430 [Rhodospirillales bacterium]|nr:hypothetical protein [Rhodospirillales bacterium]
MNRIQSYIDELCVIHHVAIEELAEQLEMSVQRIYQNYGISIPSLEIVARLIRFLERHNGGTLEECTQVIFDRFGIPLIQFESGEALQVLTTFRVHSPLPIDPDHIMGLTPFEQNLIVSYLVYYRNSKPSPNALSNMW